MDYTLSLTSLVSPPESDWVQGVPEFDLHLVSPLLQVEGVWLATERQRGVATGGGIWQQAEGWEGCGSRSGTSGLLIQYNCMCFVFYWNCFSPSLLNMR